MQGYQPRSLVLTKSLNGWVWGNLIIGWLVGFVVDFASGSAYKLEPAIIQVHLETALLDNGERGLFAVARLLTEDGKGLQESKALMEPIPQSEDSAAAALPR